MGEGTIPHVLKGVRTRFELYARKGDYSSRRGKSSRDAWRVLFPKFSHKV